MSYREENDQVILSRVHLTAKCGCGGEMIPHPFRKLRWICARSHWWNRRKHAYLIARIGLNPASSCTPSAPPSHPPARR